MTRYWIEFESDDSADIPFGLKFGCGITAFNLNDVQNILKSMVFKGGKVPPFSKVIENIDVSTLDAGHVLPNMAPPNWRGVWFPLGYNY